MPRMIPQATAVLLALLPASLPAQEVVPIRFAPGTSRATINGTVQGHGYIDYVLGAKAGQEMTATLTVSGTNGHGAAFFNILPAGKDFGGPYVGSTDDDSTAEVILPEDGDWAIRVYLMGNDRDADKTVGYSIDVTVR